MAALLAAGVLCLAPLLVTEARAQTTPTVDFGAATYTATEGGAAVEVEVTLSASPSAEVTIPLIRTNGSNTTDADYSGVPAILTFGTSDTSKTFPVTAVDDSTDEPENSVTLSFGTLPPEVTSGTTTTAVVTLVDNDDPPMLSVNDASATEGSAITFTVTLSAASEKTVTVSAATSLETGDFTAVSSETLTFMPGDTTKTVSVSTTQDTTDEDNETFSLKLSGATNATISDEIGQACQSALKIDPLLGQFSTLNNTTRSAGVSRRNDRRISISSWSSKARATSPATVAKRRRASRCGS